MSTSSLKSLQTSTLTTLLSTPTQPWKILIYDPHCRSIVSPLLTVSGLRSRGVTLHLALDSNRTGVPGVEVVYFVEANEENVKRIIQDIERNLYTADIHIFFPSKVRKRGRRLEGNRL
jgi:sec1 family domain-containing protein 1